MGKIVGMFLILGGIASFLYHWVMEQKNRTRRLEEVLIFLQKSIVTMEEEKIRIIDYLESYRSRDNEFEESLKKVADQLRKNIYPNGQMVWELVFEEKAMTWNCNEELFGILLAIGNGLFGKTRNENLCFLRKSLKELEVQMEKGKEKDAQERKVWIPVGMLGGIMFMIILI